jgi:hypothetical protein
VAAQDATDSPLVRCRSSPSSNSPSSTHIASSGKPCPSDASSARDRRYGPTSEATFAAAARKAAGGPSPSPSSRRRRGRPAPRRRPRGPGCAAGRAEAHARAVVGGGEERARGEAASRQVPGVGHAAQDVGEDRRREGVEGVAGP